MRAELRDAGHPVSCRRGFTVTTERNTRRPDSVTLHCDQGSQYTSIAFGNRGQEMGVRPSIGAVGDAFWNIPSNQTSLKNIRPFENQIDTCAWDGARPTRTKEHHADTIH